MTWLWWIILAVIFWFTLRFSPTASWLNLFGPRPWDPRDGHPDGGPTEAELDRQEQQHSKMTGPNRRDESKLNRGVVLPAVSSNWQKHRRREP